MAGKTDQATPKNTGVTVKTLTTDYAKKPDVNIWQVHCSTQGAIRLRTKVWSRAGLSNLELISLYIITESSGTGFVHEHLDWNSRRLSPFVCIASGLQFVLIFAEVYRFKGRT
ncbi:hypothetical protein N0V88_007864 [Collariella sp. IMI 366227]|nr:hypothetical protein N0V88_007864 [Collariella sp. IMI 366227]